MADEPMSASVRASLDLDSPGWEALHAAGGDGLGDVPGVPDEPASRALLVAGLDAAIDPQARVVSTDRQRRIEGWMTADHAALLAPGDAERLAFTALSVTHLPRALAMLHDLGPRPRYEPPVLLRLSLGELAHLLAGRPTAGHPQDPDREAAEQLLATGVREHWRVEIVPLWDDPSLDPRIVEVLDTDGGLWFVDADEHGAVVRPTTPLAVWRVLTALPPRPWELPPRAPGGRPDGSS